MKSINYLSFSEVNANDFIPLLNKLKIREHLINHDLFDNDSIIAWIKSKLEVDSTHGCIVRAVIINDQLAGWCGIQLEDEKYEIAIVIDDKFWGSGKAVFHEIMDWAKDFGHEEILIHFLHTRPEYKFFQNISTKVYTSVLMGNKFTTYQLPVK